MITKTSVPKEPTDGTLDDDPAKTRRAATESMTVHPSGDALWDVYSGENSHYEVFGFDGLTLWKCTCPDHEYRQCECKHIRRVQMELGLREIPETPNHPYPDVERMIDARARTHGTSLADRCSNQHGSTKVTA